MNDDMSKTDIIELERRRLVEAVTESVEQTLRKRYTWLAIVVSFLIGGGVATAVISLTGDAKRKLIETEMLLERSKKAIIEVETLSANVKEKYEKVDKELTGALAGRSTLVDRLEETARSLQGLESQVNSLTKVINTLLAKQNIKKTIPVDKKSTLPDTLDRIILSKYTVYLQYYNKDDEVPISKLRNFLKDKGYVAPGMEKVPHKYRDIRYFHDEDKDAASLLKAHTEEFMRNVLKRDDIELEIKPLGESFPHAPKQIIELWLYL
jgi:hypothetical protein